MPFFCHSNKLSFVQGLYSLSKRYYGKWNEEEDFDWFSTCGFEPSYGKFYLIHYAVKMWCELDLNVGSA